MRQAFCELISRYSQKLLPKMGGLDATVIVTVSKDSLMGRVAQAGVLDTGDRISPGLVLGGDSMPLDLGREKRLHTEAQRVAITLRDRTCRAVGCDAPGVSASTTPATTRRSCPTARSPSTDVPSQACPIRG
jgi:hypothetical protein